MSHPLQSIFDKYGSIFLPLAALTLILLVVLGAIPQNPSIVQFELAGTVDEIDKILQAWGTKGQVQAAFSLGLGFLAIATYTNTIAIACIWAANINQAHGLLSTVGIWLAWGQWLAGLLDIVIAITLVLILFGITEPTPQIVQLLAISKFSLIVVGLLYSGFSAVVHWLPLKKQTL